jgi:hypothetical protein
MHWNRVETYVARTRHCAQFARTALVLLALYGGCTSPKGSGADNKRSSSLASQQQALNSASYKAMILAHGAVGYWRLDEPGGTQIVDSAPTANHGSTFGTYPDSPRPAMNRRCSSASRKRSSPEGPRWAKRAPSNPPSVPPRQQPVTSGGSHPRHGAVEEGGTAQRCA